ncbi:MAG: helix-turn-helix domain-containing protein, partial [Rhodobiaceae bacterium]
PHSAKQVEAHFSAIIGPRAETFRDTVSSHIQSLMPQGTCRIAHVADQMGITRRTVHRRLAEEGTSFSQLVQQNRVRLADSYTNSAAKKRSKTEIAQLLGYANLSSFSRWTKSRNQG